MEQKVINMEEWKEQNLDYVVRGTAMNDEIRVFAATTRNLVQKAHELHHTAALPTAALGRTLTAGIMMGSMLKGDRDLLTIIMKGNGPLGGVTVTADSHGHVKGFVYNTDAVLPPKSKGHLDVGGGFGKGTLTVVRDLGLKEPYSSTINLVSGEIAEDLTYYFAESEQVPSSVGLGVLVGTDQNVRQAGGFIIQLMLDCSEEAEQKLEANLRKIKSVTQMLEEGMTPEQMLAHIMPDMELEIMEKTSAEFRCDCSRERVSGALMTVGKKEMQDMISEQKPVELQCHFCGKKYVFTVGELQQMLDSME